jgi:hypothetical protein
MYTVLTILGLAAVAVALWKLYRANGANRIAAFTARRSASSRMVSPGQFIDGNRHLDVALALTKETFFYENSDMQASVDLQWVQEIEYDTALATGVRVADGRVLRLRSRSQTFEFVLGSDVVARWHMMLPPRGGSVMTAPAV